jgi:hypothetical protein
MVDRNEEFFLHTVCLEHEHEHQHSDDFFLLLVQCKVGHVRIQAQADKYPYDQTVLLVTN